MKRLRGISLIEISVAIGIAAILLAIGIPLLHRNQSSQAVKAAADSVISALNRLRSGQISLEYVEPGDLLANVDVSPDSFPPANASSGDFGPLPGGGSSSTPTSGLNVHCNLWVLNAAGHQKGIASRIDLNPTIQVTVTNAANTTIDNKDATAIVFLPLAAAIGWQTSGHLDPNLNNPPVIQISDGPVTPGSGNTPSKVQGSAGVEIDLNAAGDFVVKQLATQ